jgi:hypothetical protein
MPSTTPPPTAAAPRTPSASAGRASIVERPADVPPVFGDAPFKIRNRLPEHPLFEPARIKKLLRTLPRERVEIRRVEVASTSTGYKRGPMDREIDPVAAFEALEERPTWMLLHDTWKHDADYAKLIEEYLADLAECFPEARGPLSDMGCWMFLSSGKSVVHFHADPDQSFLNHVKGGKTVYVYPSRILPEAQVEKLVYFQDQGVVTYDPAYEAAMYAPVHLTPGDSVFLPLYAPHRVTNDDGVCISWNVGFNTPRSRRRREAHCVNLELRHLGLSPSPYGKHARVDAMKARMRLPFRVKNKFVPAWRPKAEIP